MCNVNTLTNGYRMCPLRCTTMGDPAWSFVFAGGEILAPHGANGSGVAPLKFPCEKLSRPSNGSIPYLTLFVLLLFIVLWAYVEICIWQCLCQCICKEETSSSIFLTPVLQHTSVLWDNVRCAVKNYPIKLNWKKKITFQKWAYFLPQFKIRALFSSRPSFTLTEYKYCRLGWYIDSISLKIFLVGVGIIFSMQKNVFCKKLHLKGVIGTYDGDFFSIINK